MDVFMQEQQALVAQELEIPLSFQQNETQLEGQDENVFWMSQALKLAQYSEQMGEVPVGAVAVREGQRIGLGWNQPIAQHDPTAHAEVLALRAAGQQSQNYRLPGVTLYITLEPCPMCAAAMVHGRVQRVVYGTSDLKTGAAESVFQLLNHPKLNHHVAFQGGVLQAECQHQLQQFFKRRRAENKARR